LTTPGIISRVNDLSDQQLLRDYAEHRSEAAFAELVRRHVDLVYAASKRMTADAHAAEDVTQAVFMALAQNAARLSRHPVLSGWLHTTARNLAAKTVRAVARRQFREQEAAAMNQHSENEPPWDDIAPHLDAALGELDETERDAILLRYFEKKSAPEIAALIGISSAAAQKRVTRAVERLRESFARRGVAIGAGGIVLVLGAHAAEAAPIGFAATISTAALAGSAAPASTIVATTKAIAMTTLQKTIVAVTVATLAGTGIYEARQASRLREQNQALAQQQAPLIEQLQHLQTSPDDGANGLASLREENAQLKSNQTELLKLRGEVDGLRQQASDAEKRAKAAQQKLDAIVSSASIFKAHEAATVNGAKQFSLQFLVFAETNGNQFPTPAQFINGQREGGAFFNIGGTEIGTLEYINPGVEWREHPNTVVLRERIATETVNGTWQRIYAFADGSVQKALSNDGNFEAWEKVNTYSPPPAQNQ
jgi:RNA polymerase sigma factor (sigma-70 family)